ncbi:MAG: glycosyltransferase [Bacteroidia bacterium]
MNTNEQSHILLIAYTFPPAPGIGGRRWAKFAKYLAARGYVVHVITAKSTSGDTSLWYEDVHGNKNIRICTLPPRYPAALTAASSHGVSAKIRYHFWKRLLPVIAGGSIYDRSVLWEGAMLKAAGKIIRENNIRNVIATGAPFRVLYFSCKLKELFPGIHLISDLRDPWTEGKSYGFENLSEKRKEYEVSLEKHVFKNTDVITAPSEKILDYLEKHYRPSKVKTTVLPHAFDTDEFAEAVAVSPDPGKVRITFVGTVYEHTGHYIEAFMLALQKIKMSAPVVYDKLSLRFYTWSRNNIVEIAGKHGVSEKVEMHGPLPPKRMFATLAGSDYVLIIFTEKYKDYISTKFYEIIYLNRFIIYIGPEGKVSEFIRENNLGIAISHEEEIEPALVSLLSDVKKSVPYPHIKDLSFEKITDQLESLFI